MVFTISEGSFDERSRNQQRSIFILKEIFFFGFIFSNFMNNTECEYLIRVVILYKLFPKVLTLNIYFMTV
jgi:hypothetical protein